MGKTLIKLLCGSIGLTPILIPLTSCKTNNNQTDIDKLDSIEILSNFNNLTLEVKEEYTSNEIEVKCLNKYKQTIKSDIHLELNSLSDNSLDISIIDNKLHIGQNKNKGEYKYQLLAKSIDGNVISLPKDINIVVYKQLDIPDQIFLNGVNESQNFTTDTKTIDYDLSAKLKGEDLTEYDPTCDLSFSIESSTTKIDKDIFGNPLFSLEQNDKKISLKISPNVDGRYVGIYVLNLKATLCQNTSVYATKRLTIKLINGLEFVDETNHFIYGRETVNDKWYVKSSTTDISTLSKDTLLTSIYNIPVKGIGSNFCTSSGISKLIMIDLPESYTYIGDYAFNNQERLAAINIGNVEEIGEYAFNGCSTVRATSSEFNFKYIGKYAFNGCINLKITKLPQIISLSEGCLNKVKITEIDLGPNLLALGNNIFNECQELTNIYIWSTQVPYLFGDFVGQSAPLNYKIHVLSNLIENYKNDPLWLVFNDKLLGDLNNF